MQNVILIILLLLALALIGAVLLQRSEGGGLGMGGGGGVMSGRGAATALGKLTWVLGIAFMATSLAMTVIAARESATSSVLDRVAGRRKPVRQRSGHGRDSSCRQRSVAASRRRRAFDATARGPIKPTRFGRIAISRNIILRSACQTCANLL